MKCDARVNDKRKTHVDCIQMEIRKYVFTIGELSTCGEQRIDSQRQFAVISVAMQRDGANGRRAVIVLQLLSYLIASSG